jgi:hypothetical protein
VGDRGTIFIFVVCFLLGKMQVDEKTAFLNGELDEEEYVPTHREIAG